VRERGRGVEGREGGEKEEETGEGRGEQDKR
jgi:hypothetical protein